jgi:AcrR family transcriptional regulator
MVQDTAHQAPTKVPRAAQPGPSDQAGGSATTRERILAIALDLFTRKGYAETSLREIAAELGFSKAALYYHFASKQDILLALHMQLHSLTDGVLPLLDCVQPADDTWEQLVDMLIGFALQNRRLIEFHIRNRDALAELGEHAHRQPRDHGPPRGGTAQGVDLEGRLVDLLMDPSIALDRRVRMMASVGAIAGVLLAANAFASVPDADLEMTLRGIARDILGPHTG